MDTDSHQKEPSLSTEQIRDGVAARLDKYRGRNLFERFAMFMGMAQLLELTLKGLLHHRYGVDPDSMERWTLGRVSNALKERQLREDFTTLLDSVVVYRNHIAHELLVNELVLRDLTGGKETRLESRHLDKGIYEVEQLMLLYEWTDERGGWDGLAA